MSERVGMAASYADFFGATVLLIAALLLSATRSKRWVTTAIGVAIVIALGALFHMVYRVSHGQGNSRSLTISILAVGVEAVGIATVTAFVAALRLKA